MLMHCRQKNLSITVTIVTLIDAAALRFQVKYNIWITLISRAEMVNETVKVMRTVFRTVTKTF